MEIIIEPRAPFDFAATARFLRFTEAEAVDTFTEDVYARAIHLGNRLHFLRVTSRGARSRPQLEVSLEGARRVKAAELKTIEKIVRQMFSTDHDLKRFRARVAGDSLMSELETKCRGLHLARWPTLFEALTISILLQQISTAVALVFKRRLVERFGEQLQGSAGTFFAFPKPETLARAGVGDLRALGLTNAKAISIIELAQRASSGDLDGQELAGADNESIIERLTQLRGVGRWTAEWALMLHFGRTNVFPAGDLALRAIVVKYYNKGRVIREREIRALAEALWGEWASYAAIYFLAGMRAHLISL